MSGKKVYALGSNDSNYNYILTPFTFLSLSSCPNFELLVWFLATYNFLLFLFFILVEFTFNLKKLLSVKQTNYCIEK